MSSEEEKSQFHDILSSWVQSTIDLWTSMGKTWQDSTKSFMGTAPSDETAVPEYVRSWQSAMKVSQGLMSALTTSGTLSKAFNGLNTLPEIMLRMAKTGWDGYFYLYQQWLEKSAEGGKPARAFTFEKFDRNTFKTWTEIYEKDFRQIINIPKIGLTREYQERFTKFLNKFNLFQTNLAEFLYTLYLPIEKSLQVMQDKIGELAESGKLAGDFKEYYKMWIKILEGHYMTLFKSPEYTKMLGQLLNTVQEYRVAREEVLMDMFQNFPFPTNRDIDDVYKELYLLKRKVRELSKKIEEK